MPSDHPQTPQSPSQTSPGTHDLPSKPTTSPRLGNSLPTPAHSINGSMSSTGSGFMPDTTHLEDSSNKRKRDVEDHGDREQKKVHVEESRISIEDLHLDVGNKYLLCKTPHPPRSLALKQDLFERYSLNEIASSVARTLPNGAKKSLRKTYKNYLKPISGQFDSVRKEWEDPGSLLSISSMPQEEWDAQYRGIDVGKIPERTLANLSKAMTMARGVVPKEVWNPNVLGELNSTPAAEPAKVVHNGVRTPVPQSAGVVRSGRGELPRPKRNVKKRTYGDSSFEGYGEGFVDDDTQEGGYSTGDGDDRGGSRKRPKKSGPPTHFQGAARQNSYGPGMVGA